MWGGGIWRWGLGGVRLGSNWVGRVVGSWLLGFYDRECNVEVHDVRGSCLLVHISSTVEKTRTTQHVRHLDKISASQHRTRISVKKDKRYDK